MIFKYLNNIINKNMTEKKDKIPYSEKYTILQDSRSETDSIKFKIRSFIAYLMGQACFCGGFFGVLGIIFGNNTMKIILISILIFQYFFLTSSNKIRNFIYESKAYSVFFNYRVVLEEEIDDKNSLFGFHPHGITTACPQFSFSLHENLKNSVFLSSRALIYFPFGGLASKLFQVESVDKKNFLRNMSIGKNISFLPGGFEEATITNYWKDRVFIKNRKGFIKYALEYGYKIYPVYSFGENKLYFTINVFEKLRLMINKLKIPGALFFSPLFVLPIPNVKLSTVIGKPIILPMVKEPTEEMVNKYHKIYMEELVSLYQRHREENGGTEELEIL